jgi:tryptophan-rich sensory protein
LNFLWTPVFFGAQQIGLALVVILLILATLHCHGVAAGPRGDVAVCIQPGWPSPRCLMPRSSR